VCSAIPSSSGVRKCAASVINGLDVHCQVLGVTNPLVNPAVVTFSIDFCSMYGRKKNYLEVHCAINSLVVHTFLKSLAVQRTAGVINPLVVQAVQQE
jgi:hypothetical protein